MDWIKYLADSSIDVVSLAVMAFVLVKAFPLMKKSNATEAQPATRVEMIDPNPELIKVIQENTRAMTELSIVIKQQSELIQRLVVELAKNGVCP